MTFDPINIPTVRKLVPMSIASEIAGVQPIDSSTMDDLMRMVTVSHKCSSACATQHHLIHSFAHGYIVQKACPKQWKENEWLIESGLAYEFTTRWGSLEPVLNTMDGQMYEQLHNTRKELNERD